MTMSEQTLPPAFYAPPARKPTGFIVTIVVLAVALVGAIVFGGIQMSSVSTAEDARATALANGREAKAAADEEIASLSDDLSAAEGQAAACSKAAELLAKGANGYANLWNEVDDAADRWQYVFDFYLRSIMRRTNVPNATLKAGWDALDNCDTGSSTGIDAL
jgi:hypothetical protein